MTFNRTGQARRINALTAAKLMVAMMEEARTYAQLAEISGLHITTVRQYVNALHIEGGCFVSHWEKDRMGRHIHRSFHIGRGKDAKKPPPLDPKEKERRYRAKERQIEVMFALAALPARLPTVPLAA